ncbi:DUF3829 domain-containing protein [Tianweitania sp.]|uniref:DUF3829 domain-containing protein n=1 Tax=Tianweitania sp. TaxID=2021634 RepID=UPI00289A46B9|nr:DUF3829 domain-containing protein [Tianweitania sp.]
MPTRNHLFSALVVGFAVFLTGCNNEESQANASAGPSAEQIEIAKHNAYVKAASVMNGSFNETLDRHVQKYANRLAGTEPLDEYEVVRAFDVTNVKSALNEAIVKEGSIPEVDQTAKDYAAAVTAFEPVNSDLANYAETKGYLSDGGEKAREKDAAFVEALQKVAVAEAAFFTSMQARDDKLTRDAFETAPEGSLERYRAGVIFFGKEAMTGLNAMFASPQDAKIRADVKSSLNRLAEMAEGWDKKLREGGAEGCPTKLNAMNKVIAAGRSALSRAEKGDYSREDNSTASYDPAQFDSQQLNTDYSWMISTFNANLC